MFTRFFPKCVHLMPIQKRDRGTFGKIREELEELYDADSQDNGFHAAIEAADLINATYTFIWNRYRIPFFVVILIALVTGIYKPIVRVLKEKS